MTGRTGTNGKTGMKFPAGCAQLANGFLGGLSSQHWCDLEKACGYIETVLQRNCMSH